MKKRSLLSVLAILAVLIAVLPSTTSACTDLLVTKGASKDGSTFITYLADSHTIYGTLQYLPAGVHLPGEQRDIFDGDSGRFLGRIPEAPRTWSVIGLMNEFQVAIGETTFGGREELMDKKGVVDYGSLMNIALQRGRTAREAIRIMTDLVASHGYASSGESFSISDPNEVWIMEMISKGEGNKGAVWVALRIPDGYISGHANQARIRTFPLQSGNDWNNPKASVFHAADVVSFAREKKYFDGKDADFSFADAYCPLDFGAQRACEARVWSLFRRAAPSLNLPADFARGVKGAAPMPLWIRPDQKLGVRECMELMRDHYEGTEFDMTRDVGAGEYSLPYRWRPMSWQVDGKKYIHERAISTQQTGFSFVAQSRAWLPNPIGGVLWFGVDDTYSTVWVPMYCGLQAAPKPFASTTGSFSRFSWDSAFWVFNFVSNYAYGRYSDMIVDIQKVQRELEGRFIAEQPEIDQAALVQYKTSPELARNYLTAYSTRLSEETLARWRQLGEHLIWKYLDGNLRDELGGVKHPPHPEHWLRQIVKDHGDVIKVPEEPPKP